MIIENAYASGNYWGGFITTNPNSEFRNCVAENNGGFGFLDLSGGAENNDLIAIKEGFTWAVERYKQMAAQCEVLRCNLSEIHRAFDMLNLQFQSEQPDKGSIMLWHERIRDLSRGYASDEKAKEVFLFGSAAEITLRKMRDTGILK